jgi:hypothetical protein
MMDRIEEMPRWSTNQSSYKVASVGGHHNTSGSYGEWGSAQWGGENTRKRNSRKSQHQYSRRGSHEAGWGMEHKQANHQSAHGGWNNQPPAPPPPPPPQPQAETGFPAATSFQEPQGPIPVILEYLPLTLCRQNFLEAMLDQAGLVDDVIGVVLGDAQETGMAQITVTNWNAAVRCVAHFDGRSWDQAGNPVRATVSEEYLPQPIPNSKSPKAAAHGRNRKRTSSRSSTDSWKMDNLVLPPSPQVMPCPMPVDMASGTWMMPPPPLPLVDGCYKVAEFMPDFKPRWADVVEEPVRFDDNEQTDFEKGSTSAGSSGRHSQETNGDSFPDFACDTDDGF